MKIEHVAIWTKNLEKMREFYVNYFNGKSGEKYENIKNRYSSYFIEFETGARLELMQMETVPDNLNSIEKQYIGIIHIAFSTGSEEAVDRLTEELKKGGYTIAGEARRTGDGYYESVVLDPEGNRVEITV